MKSIYERKLKNIDIASLKEPRYIEYAKRVVALFSLDFENQDDIKKIIELYKAGGEEFSPRDAVSLEEKANSIILESFEHGFDETRTRIEESQNVQFVDYEGQMIRIVNMTGDFSAIIRSTDTGFSVEKKLENNSVREYEETNVEPEATIQSGTYVTNDFTGIAPLGENGTYFVYLNNNKENMGEIGNSDINSNIINYGVTSQSGISFPADKLTHNSRQVYAEATLIDRTRPDAIAIFDDSTERQKAIAIQAADEYGVDLLYFDKSQIVAEQINKLDALENNFRATGDLQQLETLISTYETNIAGWLLNRDENVKDESLFIGIDNSRFLPQFTEKENDIYMAIADFCRENSSRDKVMEIVNILRREQAKYDDIEESKKFPNVKMRFKAQELIAILNKKYELGLDTEYTNEASNLYAQLRTEAVLPSIVQKALGNDRITTTDLKRGEALIAGLNPEKGECDGVDWES